MTQTIDFEVVGSYNNQRITSIDAERSVNMFEYIDPLGKKPRILINTSGIRKEDFNFGLATGGVRRQFVFNSSNSFAVIGKSVFLITENNAVSKIGEFLNTVTGHVGIDANTFQVIFVDGVNGYIWDTIDRTFNQITDSSFPNNPIDVCTLDNFFVVAHGNTNNFQLSSFNQGMVWGPASNAVTTNIASLPDQLIVGISNITGGPSNTANYQTGIPVTLQLGSGGSLSGSGLTTTDTYYIINIDDTHVKLATSYENAIAGIAVNITGNVTAVINMVSNGQLQQGSITTHPGTIVACRTLHRRLFLFSQYFTEVWENQGIGSNLPFRRNNSILMEYGTPAIGTVSAGFDKMFFLSQDRDGLGSVMMVIGAEAIPVSNRALDFAFAQYAQEGKIADCTSFLIKENGLIFYRMNFTEANHTYVYNVTLSNPAEEQGKLWHEEEILNGDRHPAQTHAYFNGVNYVGDYSQPIIYVLDSDIFTNNGQTIRRMRITKPFVPPGYQRIRVDRLQLDLLQGNILNIVPEFFNLNLLTEISEDIETEDGIDLELEQALEVRSPQNLFVFLSVSKDGGQTFGYSTRTPMGHLGQRTFRTLWRKLGVIPRGQAFVCKFEFFDACPFIILGASWAIDILPE